MRFAFLILLVSSLSLAANTKNPPQEPKPIDMTLLPDEGVEVLESVISVNGVRYHAIEYHGGVYYLKLLNLTKNFQSMGQYCKQAPVKVYADERVTPFETIESKVTTVSELFMESLRRHCQPVASVEDLALDPGEVGLANVESKRKKPLYYNPLEDLLGLQSDF